MASRFFQKRLERRSKFAAIKKMMVPLSAVLLSSSSCSGPEQDAFEIAKAHVWGDKVNGCDYQTITFSNNMIVRKNSQEMIDKVGLLDKSIIISEVESLPLSKVKKNGERFTLFIDENNDVLTFQLSGDELQWYSTDEKGLIKIGRGGKAIPTDFVVCK